MEVEDEVDELLLGLRARIISIGTAVVDDTERIRSLTIHCGGSVCVVDGEVKREDLYGRGRGSVEIGIGRWRDKHKHWGPGKGADACWTRVLA